ncbi:PLP-dependent aminotransferase family protein [Kiloniella antarctica]|uniref:PLP-dependent aminotransferase family protein n=1 Tax=Kiloniella antarctica TaxID=1550907 RepID=A0ABW5BP39_9PROT
MWKPELNPEVKIKYLAVVDAIATAIRKGELRPGEQLPTHRDLAWDLKMNLSTVTQAYKEATRRHLIGGEVGRGTFVLASSREAELFALKKKSPKTMIDLSTNLPADFPDDECSQILLGEGLEKGIGLNAFSYHSPEVLMRAQVASSHWLSWRGCEVEPREIVPCAGAQQALFATLLALCGPGATVLVEEYTFPGMKAIARQLRLRLHGVSCDEEGILPEALYAAINASGAKIAVLVPNLQNPTGTVMLEQRRKAIAKIIKENDLLVIEDDVYGALSGMPPLAIDLPNNTVLLSSLSKAVSPGLRFGFVSGAERWIAPIRAEVHATHWAMSPFMIELACLWIEEGRAFARADWQRHEVERRWNLAQSRLRGLGAVCWKRTPCPHLWLLTSGASAETTRKLRANGVEVVPDSFFAAGRKETGRIRICLTAPKSCAVLSQALDKIIGCADAFLYDA